MEKKYIESEDVITYDDIIYYGNVFEELAWPIIEDEDEKKKKIFTERLNAKLNRLAEYFFRVVDEADSYYYLNWREKIFKSLKTKEEKDVMKDSFRMNLCWNPSGAYGEELIKIDIGNKYLAQDDTLPDITYYFVKDNIMFFEINYYNGDFKDHRIRPLKYTKNNGKVVNNILYLEDKSLVTESEMDFFQFRGPYYINAYLPFCTKDRDDYEYIMKRTRNMIKLFQKYFKELLDECDSFILEGDSDLEEKLKKKFEYVEYDKVYYKLNEIHNVVFRNFDEKAKKYLEGIKLDVSTHCFKKDLIIEERKDKFLFDNNASPGKFYFIKNNRVIFELYPNHGYFFNNRVRSDMHWLIELESLDID